MSSRVPVAVLISGRGSNMTALVEACRDPAFPAAVALVIANNPDAAGLRWAAAAGIPTLAIDHRAYPRDREAHERAIDAALQEAGIALVCLAGYMRLLTAFFTGRWQGRMLNIHPSLLPAFPGLHTHERALAAGVKLHGCTVHLVTEVMDEGPILGQAAIPVHPDDTPETLGARVLTQEHRLYPAALAAHLSASGLAPPPARRWAAGDEAGLLSL